MVEFALLFFLHFRIISIHNRHIHADIGTYTLALCYSLLLDTLSIYNPSNSPILNRIELTMAAFSKLSISTATAFLILGAKAIAGSLVPPQDILLPPSSSASDPLRHLGANSPWFAGEFFFEKSRT